MTVKAFKLITGEELICTTDNDLDGFVFASNPAVVVIQEMNGQHQLGLMPYAPYAVSVKFFPGSIIAELELDVKLENEYNRMFGSGIQIASAGQIRA
jgi:hypothetical protein